MLNYLNPFKNCRQTTGSEKLKSVNLSKEPPILSSKSEALKKVPGFSDDTKLKLGLALVLIGLALIPFTGSASLMMIIPGVAMLIPTTVGIGIGSGLCGAGIVYLLSQSASLKSRINVAMVKSEIRKLTSLGLSYQRNIDVLRKEENAIKTKIREAQETVSKHSVDQHGEESVDNQNLMRKLEREHLANRGQQAMLENLSIETQEKLDIAKSQLTIDQLQDLDSENVKNLLLIHDQDE